MKKEIVLTGIVRFCIRCERELDIAYFGRKQNKNQSIRAYCRDCEDALRLTRLTALKEKVYDKLGHTCTRCGFDDKRALQIDHVYGGGNKEHKEIKSQHTFLKKVLEDTEGTYQILCANCNWIKRAEQREAKKDVKPFTEEEIERIIETRKRRPISDLTRERLSKAGKGKPAWNIGVPAWNRGTSWSEEVKASIGAGIKKAYAKKTPEERSKLAKSRNAEMTPEQRSDRAKKGAEYLRIRRETNPAPPKIKPLKLLKKAPDGSLVPHKWSDEDRLKQREVAAKREAAKTPEQKAAQAAKRKATLAAKKVQRTVQIMEQTLPWLRIS